MNKTCENCKLENIDLTLEPCLSCTEDNDNFIPKEQEKYEYFVSYNFINKNEGSGFGNTSVTLPNGITKHEDIRNAEKLLREECDLESVVLINYIMLEG